MIITSLDLTLLQYHLLSRAWHRKEVHMLLLSQHARVAPDEYTSSTRRYSPILAELPLAGIPALLLAEVGIVLVVMRRGGAQIQGTDNVMQCSQARHVDISLVPASSEHSQ